jgi:hypothetical protein
VTLLRSDGLAVLLSALAGCAHAAAPSPSADVLSVTVAAARYALDHEVPAVFRQATICLEVDGGKPPAEVLARLSSTSVQVSGGPTACVGPRAVLLQVSGVVVSGDSAVARAGVQLGVSSMLQLRKVEGQWRVLRPQGQTGSGQLLQPPLPGP